MVNSNLLYRPDIDGLRAIAVCSVIVFHAFPGLLPGGFVGVDIFFVISGFLITSILLKEVRSGKFSIGSFYIRRIHRLLPALILVLTATFVIGWWVLLSHEFINLGKHIVSSVLFSSNILLLTEIGYFDASSELKPLLHLWSLGVEEQFYIAWPLIIYLVYRYRFGFLKVTGSLTICAFLLNVILTNINSSYAFYLPFPRFWELLIGALLANHFANSHLNNNLIKKRIPCLSGSVSYQLASLTGIAIILVALFVIDKNETFPGLWALLPVFGAALLIAAGPDSVVNRNLLSNKLLVNIGLISYPLYLWHWPLLSYARIIYSTEPPLSARVVIVFLTFILALVTYKCMELPLRRITINRYSPFSVARFFLILLVCVALLGLVVKNELIKERIHGVSAKLSAAATDWDVVKSGEFVFTGDIDSKVLFFGDSYIQQLSPRIIELQKNNLDVPATVRFITSPGCVPIDGIQRITNSACQPFANKGFEIARSNDIKKVVIGGSWLGMGRRGDYYFQDDPSRSIIDFSNDDELARVLMLLEADISVLSDLNKDIYLVLIPPGGYIANPSNFKGRIALYPMPEVRSVDVQVHKKKVSRMNNVLVQMAARQGVTIIDPAGWFCDESKCYFSDSRGDPYFKDDTHIRSSYVRCCITAFDKILRAP
jgi:peptidoglycan/LPS O-acetylase OafA/YrhL